jgi:VCBS repeat protein/fibronectin type III domain protein
MAFDAPTARRAVSGLCALLALAGLAGCEGTFGDSPPHAAPANPVAEASDGQVALSWDAVTDATRYAILWDDNDGAPTYENEINDLEDTEFTHTGLVNFREYHYKVVAETSGGRGPESIPVEATPGPVPGAIEWAVVTAQNPGHTIYFDEAPGANGYRIYFAALESQLAGNRPDANFVEADASPAVREDVPVTTGLYYRVVPMNDSRVGTGSPIVVAPSLVISGHDMPLAGVSFGTLNDDDCPDLATADGGTTSGVCTSSFTERDLEEAGLEDLLDDPRLVSDVRFADFNGDGLDDIFSNTRSAFADTGSFALFHVNQDEGVFETSAAVSALDIRGVGGTLLAADFDNDGDVDLFAPYESEGGARNWLLVNDGAGAFTDTAAAAGVAANPPGEDFVPRGGQAVDFDEDGFVDLLFGSRLLLNDGDGTFSDGSAAAHVPVARDQGLKLMDVDLDGDLDLAEKTSTTTRIYRNTGGVFDDGEVLGDSSGDGHGLTACDINGDGFEDLLVARNTPDKGAPRIFLNIDGSLTLSATQEGTSTDPDSLVSFNERLACGDQNLDGMPDVLVRWGDPYRLLRPSTPLTRKIRLRVVDGAGHRNQQGRIVRVVPESHPERIMTRVVESGSGLRSQGTYDLVFGAPWTGDYEVTVGFAGGEVTTTLEAGDQVIIFADGRVEEMFPDEEE